MNSSTSFPPGYTTENRSGEVLRITIVFVILEIIFVGLYFISRMKTNTAYTLDAVLIYCALFSDLGILPINIVGVKYAASGRHLITASISETGTWLKLNFVWEFFYPPCTFLPKLSILCFYHRLFGIRNTVRWGIYMTAGVIIGTWISGHIIVLVQCKPIAYTWNRKIPGGTCLDVGRIEMFYGIPNIATDIAVLTLPLPSIWELQTSRAKRLGLVFTFMTAGVGLITAILRLVSFIKSVNFFSNDFTWLGVDPVVYTTIESGTYLIAACLPSLRSLAVYRARIKDLTSSVTKLFGYITEIDGTKISSRPLRNLPPEKNLDSDVAGFTKLSGEHLWPEKAHTKNPAALCHSSNQDIMIRDLEIGDQGRSRIYVTNDYIVSTTTSQH